MSLAQYQSPYSKGWDAFFNGVKYADNPYPAKSTEADKWSNGWLAALEQVERTF